MKKFSWVIFIFILLCQPSYAGLFNDIKMVKLTNGPFGFPLGEDLNSVLQWCEKDNFVIKNLSRTSLEDEIRNNVISEVRRDSEAVYRQNAEKLSKYTIDQIKALLLKYQKGENVGFSFAFLNVQNVLGKISFWEKAPVFSYKGDVYYLKETFSCDGDNVSYIDYANAVCDRADLRSFQIVVACSSETAFVSKDVKEIFIHLYKDEDQHYKAYSVVIKGEASSSQASVDMLSVLQAKYGIPGRYIQSRDDDFPLSVKVLMYSGVNYPTFAVYVWGSNLSLFCSGAMATNPVEWSGGLDYALFYADPLIGKKFFSNYKAVIDQIKRETKMGRDSARNEMESSF